MLYFDKLSTGFIPAFFKLVVFNLQYTLELLGKLVKCPNQATPWPNYIRISAVQT